MNANPKRVSSNAETQDAGFSASSVSSAPQRGAKVELIEGSGPQFAYETQCLLQRRLRAAAIILLFACGLFLVRRLFVESPLWSFHLGVVMLLGMIVAGLSTPCQHSMKKLRVVELLVFGVPALFLAARQYALMLQEAQRGNATLTLAGMKSSVIYFFGLIVVYGMFIPNTWRRTAMIVFPMAVLPPAVAITLRLSQPEFEVIAQQVATFEQVSDHVLMLLIGAVLSTYGLRVRCSAS